MKKDNEKMTKNLLYNVPLANLFVKYVETNTYKIFLNTKSTNPTGRIFTKKNKIL